LGLDAVWAARGSYLPYDEGSGSMASIESKSMDAPDEIMRHNLRMRITTTIVIATLAGGVLLADTEPAMAASMFSPPIASPGSAASSLTKGNNQSLASAPALVAEPGPGFIYPSDGSNHNHGQLLQINVTSVSNATGYLFGFFQGGEMVWENYRDEGKLSNTNYEIPEGSPAWQKFHKGVAGGAAEVEVWARALVNGEWTDATIIRIYLW
jgi:hypothetical protein